MKGCTLPKIDLEGTILVMIALSGSGGVGDAERLKGALIWELHSGGEQS